MLLLLLDVMVLFVSNDKMDAAATVTNKILLLEKGGREIKPAAPSALLALDMFMAQ